ncbi:DUF1127 domain-containing protein [Bradyrhizobium frederickii]|uniref:DUF1127 domain-containing protein n=1 Tax=Bradyrhizobium frederickii TaxID=2560054 RepID=A0A4Y9NP86_9BRAD|nr:DUF1127 domain-containing protein [Bradyrhizobium frederickii]
MRCRRSQASAPTTFASPRGTTGRRRKMTTISQTAGRSFRPSSSGGFFSTLANAAYALFDRLERRSAVKTLNELDDRALRDIGITRSQIEDAVYGQVRTELTRYL